MDWFYALPIVVLGTTLMHHHLPNNVWLNFCIMTNITCVEQQWQLNSVVKTLHNDKHYLC
jgi:hypothetical protein